MYFYYKRNTKNKNRSTEKSKAFVCQCWFLSSSSDPAGPRQASSVLRKHFSLDQGCHSVKLIARSGTLAARVEGTWKKRSMQMRSEAEGPGAEHLREEGPAGLPEGEGERRGLGLWCELPRSWDLWRKVPLCGLDAPRG